MKSYVEVDIFFNYNRNNKRLIMPKFKFKKEEKDKDKMVTYTLRMPKELNSRLKGLAKDNDASMNEVLLQMIEKCLKDSNS